MLFKRIVSGLQVFALVFVLVTAVLLVVRQPPASTVTSGGAAAADPGAPLFAAHCASCHGPQGQGGLGPPLMGQVTVIYPDVADQIAVVADGKGSMPGFSGSLSSEQIRQIVDFTRADPASAAGAGTADGKAIYLDQCAACHGDFGEGTYGPAFKGGLAEQRFPNSHDQVAVVLAGRPGTSMRGFADKLTPAEVQAVVDYTRSL